MHTCRLAPTTSLCLVHTYRLAPTGSNADSNFESAEKRRLAPTIGSPFGTHLPTNADSQSAVGDIANCRLPVGRCALSIILRPVIKYIDTALLAADLPIVFGVNDITQNFA